MRALLLPLLLCVCAPQVPDDGPAPEERQEQEPAKEKTGDEPIPVLAPRLPIAGMRLVSATSVLRFDGQEERPHRLEAIYVFPDRARWSLRAIGEEKERGSRLLRYHAGDRCFGLAPGLAQSDLLEGRDAEQALLQFELRRAALLWPDGFGWQGEGLNKTAALREIGSLTAEFAEGMDPGSDPAPRPVRFASWYLDGSSCERLDAVRWDTQTRWPAAWELWLADRRVWTEEITEIAHDGNYLDFFFLPPDRRAAPAARLGRVEFQHADLPRRAVRRRALDPSWTDLDEARRAAREAAVQWRGELAKLGVMAEVRASLELDAQGHVSALLARVDSPGEIAPAWGAAEVADGPALLVRLPAFGPVSAERLRALGERRPAGSRSGSFELRWDEKAGVRVLLPLLPRTL